MRRYGAISIILIAMSAATVCGAQPLIGCGIDRARNRIPLIEREMSRARNRISAVAPLLSAVTRTTSPLSSFPGARHLAPDQGRPPLVKLSRLSPPERKAKMRGILSRKEFSGSQRSAADRFWGWLGEVVRRAPIFGDGVSSSAGSRFVSIALAIVVLMLFLLLLAHVVARLGIGRLSGLRSSETEDLYAGPDTPRGALEEASRAAGAGDFRGAVRLVYLAVLLRLDERDLIRFDRTGTNWEYLAALRSAPEFHQLLRPVTVTFDRKWYGREATVESDYRAFVDVYDAAESLEAGR